MASGGSTGFTAAVDEEPGDAEQLNQVLQAWEGGDDRGVPLDLTEVEHATKYALDVRNKETDSSLLARFRNAANEVVMLIVKSAITIGKACSFTSTVAFSCAVIFPDDWISADEAGWAMLEDGLFAANATGMAKMADGFLAASEAGMAKMAAGFLAADATGQAKMANDFIDSQHYVDGSIDKAHLAADIIDGTKIADDVVDSEHYVHLSIDGIHISSGAVGEAKLGTGAVTATKIGTGAVEADKIGTGVVVNAKLGPDAVTGAKIQDDAVDSEHYVDGSIDRAHLAADIVDGTKIEDDAVDSEHLAAGGIDAEHLAADIVDDTKVGNRVPALIRRQGSSATEWNAAGATAYTPTTARVQVGVAAWSGDASAYGEHVLTFPVAFSYIPIVIASAKSGGQGQQHIVNITSASPTQVTLRWNITSGTTPSVELQWIAIGPE